MPSTVRWEEGSDQPEGCHELNLAREHAIRQIVFLGSLFPGLDGFGPVGRDIGRVELDDLDAAFDEIMNDE